MSEVEKSLTQIERELNEAMKCPVGKNQVYIRGSIIRQGPDDKPEIRLRCRLRAHNGLSAAVGQKFIEEVCCADPDTKCPFYRTYLRRKNRS